MIPDERYAVRDETVERALRTLAAQLEDNIPEGMAFALFLVHFGEHEAFPVGKGAVFYISSAERVGILDVLEAWCQRERAKGAQ